VKILQEQTKAKLYWPSLVELHPHTVEEPKFAAPLSPYGLVMGRERGERKPASMYYTDEDGLHALCLVQLHLKPLMELLLGFIFFPNFSNKPQNAPNKTFSFASFLLLLYYRSSNPRIGGPERQQLAAHSSCSASHRCTQHTMKMQD